jgi:proteasome assembly chaperone (PAC2) family protein
MHHPYIATKYLWPQNSFQLRNRMKKMDTRELIKIIARPKLNEPNLIAAWPGVSSVALIIATYLLDKLPFKDLAEIKPMYFFEPIGVLARDNIIEAPSFPQSRFFYYKNPSGPNDLILFIGDAQPPAKAYDMANAILDLGNRFRMNRIYTCAAAMTKIHHTEQPTVRGVATNQAMASELERLGLVRGGNLQISGLNGLLLGVAKERNIDGVCLLGDVPSYSHRIQNPMAALAVLDILKPLLGVELDTRELAEVAKETQQRIKEFAAEAMEDYIDYFTEPIWEQGEEYFDDEEDEED